MMKKRIFLFIQIIIFVVISQLAVASGMASDTTACEEYKQIKFSVSVVGTKVRYDLSNNGTLEPPHADSVWITFHTEDTTSVVYTGHAQSGEFIDISSFERGFYGLHVLIGECKMAQSFIFRGRGQTTTLGQEPVVTNTASKILRNGQILILRGDKTYTLQGQQVE